MERIKMERIALAGIFAGSLLLSGCGSSSGSSSSDAQPTPGNPTTPEAPVTTQTVSGTAAIGAAITDGTVTAVCSDGSSFTESVTTDANGNWSGEVADGAMPCALQVTGGNPPVTLHSYVAAPGTVNITPLTDLIMASATLEGFLRIIKSASVSSRLKPYESLVKSARLVAAVDHILVA